MYNAICEYSLHIMYVFAVGSGTKHVCCRCHLFSYLGSYINRVCSRHGLSSHVLQGHIMQCAAQTSAVYLPLVSAKVYVSCLACMLPIFGVQM